MTPGHRGASGLPSGWLDDPLGATVFRPVALGPLRVEMPNLEEKSRVWCHLVCNVIIYRRMKNLLLVILLRCPSRWG